MRYGSLAGGVVLLIAVSSGAARAAPIYSNNFDSGSTAGFSGSGGYTPTIVAAPNGSTSFLGDLSTGQSTAVLTLNTSGYSSVTLSYTLDAVLSQDGIGPAGGNTAANPDSFVVSQNGVTLSDYSFANYGGDQQSYCPGMTSPCAPQTGASSVEALGYNPGSGYDDAEYRFTYTFTPTSGTTLISFTSNDNEGVGNEFYGIDDVLVTGTPSSPVSAAPEPGAWALMLVGLGAMGLAMRRRRIVATLA